MRAAKAVPKVGFLLIGISVAMLVAGFSFSAHSATFGLVSLVNVAYADVPEIGPGTDGGSGGNNPGSTGCGCDGDAGQGSPGPGNCGQGSDGGSDGGSGNGTGGADGPGPGHA